MRLDDCVKCSKIDPFDTGFILHVGYTRDEIFPVAAMLSCLAQRPPDHWVSVPYP